MRRNGVWEEGRPTSEHGILFWYLRDFSVFQIKRDEGKISKTYGEKMCVVTKTHSIVIAIRSITSFTRLSQTSFALEMRNCLVSWMILDVGVIIFWSIFSAIEGKMGEKEREDRGGKDRRKVQTSHAHLTSQCLHSQVNHARRRFAEKLCRFRWEIVWNFWSRRK